MRLDGLIFDLDGTLLDSAADLCQALNATLRQNNRESLSLDEVKSMTGDGMMPMINRAFTATGVALSPDETTAVFNQFIAHYANLVPDRGQLYPHVVETLDFYRQAGVKIALCTNKQELATRRLMRDLNLIDHFDFIAGGDTFPVQKPHAGHIRGVLEALSLSAPEVVMIGDSANDIMAAKGAGVKCIAITHGYGSDIANYGADEVMANFLQLPAVLAKFGFTLQQ